MSRSLWIKLLIIALPLVTVSSVATWSVLAGSERPRPDRQQLHSARRPGVASAEDPARQ